MRLLLDHGDLQRCRAADLLVQEVANDAGLDDDRRRAGERGHVDGAVRDHWYFADARQLPSSWREYAPTWVDIAMFIGSFGLFMTLFLLFCRFLPIVAMAEVKAVLTEGHKPGGQH